jgi:2-dehydro-3-deoxygluconokinase
MPATTVTFGEIMLRLTPPGFERLLQSPTLLATFGGGEANVAASLAGFGLPAAFVTILPQANGRRTQPLASSPLRRRHVAHRASAGRMGIYFLETGASQRVVESRTTARRVRSRWPRRPSTGRVLAGAGWFHVTGITPGASGGESRDRGAPARHGHHGLVRSEFRKNLWKWGKSASGGDAPAREVIGHPHRE